jgi:adenylate cyclase
VTQDQRRLAAIVSADAVGYSRLMGRDESGTVAALKAHRRELIDPKIAEHNGRIVKTTGDGLLLEFPSVVDAVRCAVDVQRGMAERNTSIPADHRIEFRFGINVGDIIIDGEDIFGDGVNVAARLQALAEPGGIYVSKVVRDQVLDKLNFTFEDLGAQRVKNIARPVEIFRVDFENAPPRTASPARPVWRLLRRAAGLRWLGGGVIAVCVVAFAVWSLWHFSKTTSSSAPASGQAPAMSIAVLPFNAVGGKVIDESLAQSLTQDVTAALARSARYALVASYGSVSRYKENALDVRAAGRDLNVRYLGEGDIRQDGDKVVVAVRMIDAGTARQVWSDRLDTTTTQLSTNADAVAGVLANRIRKALFDSEVRRASQQSGAKADAADLWLRGIAVEDGTLNRAREALKLYDESLRLDPKFAPALINRTLINESLLELEPQADRDRLIREMDDSSGRAVAADRSDPRAWAARSAALVFQYRWNEALEAFDESLRIDPNRTAAYKGRALVMIWMGRPQDAFAELDKAVALDVREADDGETMRIRCRAHLALGRYDDAIKVCERAAALQDTWSIYLYLAAAYAQQGEMSKASTAKAQLLKLQPGYTIARFRTLRISDAPAYWQQAEAHIIAGLRKAGLPEQ